MSSSLDHLDKAVTHDHSSDARQYHRICRAGVDASGRGGILDFMPNNPLQEQVMTDPIGTAQELIVGLGQVRYILRSVANGDDQSEVAAKAAEIVETAADALQSRIAEVGRLTEAVEHAEHVFRCYADLHERKGTADGHTKARRNIEHAERMSAALSRQKE